MEDKIPKIIHYCWFGPGFMPQTHKRTVNHWKNLMPDWRFIRWSEKNFDINCSEYTRRAYKEKKYAFVSDVARLYALSKYGGIYLDTDFELYQPLDSFLNHIFSAIEVFKEFEGDGKFRLDSQCLPKDINLGVPYFGLLAAIIGANKNSQIIQESLSFYGLNSERALRVGFEPMNGGGFCSIR